MFYLEVFVVLWKHEMNLNVLLSNEETLSGILHENVWEVDCQHLGLLKNMTDNSEQFN